MLQITPQHRLCIAVAPADFRCGIDGLSARCKKHLEQDPFDGCLFVFRNKRSTAVKLLNYDGNGFWLCQKRFSRGRLAWWPTDPAQASRIRAVDLLVMLQQGNPQTMKVPYDWRRCC